MTREPERSYSLSAPLRFDFDGTASKADPFAFFASLREAGPVIPVKLPFVGKAWITTTHEATSAMVKDNVLFVQEARHAGKTGVAGLAWWMPASLKLITNNMLLKDELDHRRLRKLVDQAFQRRRVRDMRGEIEGMADRLLDGFEGREEVDLATAFSRRLPLEVICEMMGVPDEDRRRVYEIGNQLVGFDDPDLQPDGQTGNAHRGRLAAAEMFLYADKLREKAR